MARETSISRFTELQERIETMGRSAGAPPLTDPARARRQSETQARPRQITTSAITTQVPPQPKGGPEPSVEAGLKSGRERQPETADGELSIETRDSQVPDWRRPPVALSAHPADLIADLKATLADAQARLVTLTLPMTVVVLRARLPRGLSVQPDGDGANATTVLLYRSSSVSMNETDLRLCYRFVDLLGLLSPTGCLNPDLHEALENALTDHLLPLHPIMEEHVEARARWRRTIPTSRSDLQGLLFQMSPASLSQLAHLFVQVSQQDPRTGTGVPRILHDFCLPVPSPGWVKEIVGQQGRPRAYPPPHPPTSGPTQLSPLRVNGQMDMDRIAAARANTTHARQELLNLDELAEGSGLCDIHEAPEEVTATSSIPEAGSLAGSHLSDPVRELAEQLCQQERHLLSTVRDLAAQFGLVPLEAIRTINEWAECRTADRDDIYDAAVEVDESRDAVWVDPFLRELLA